MDQVPVSPEMDAVVPAAPPERPICGFWIRLLALLIDLVILRIVGVVLGMVFGDLFVMMGNFARLVGFAIVLAYFGILQSCDGNGQSLGQRITGIRVVGTDGNCISVFRSMCRTTILWLPALLSQPIMSLRVLMSPIGIAFGILWWACAGALVYFYLFNGRTRQSTHDLICRTYVVKANAAGLVDVGGVSRAHYAVFPALVVVLGVAGAVFVSFLASGPLSTVFTLANRFPGVKGGTVTGISENYQFSSSGGRFHTIQVIVVPSMDGDPQKLADQAGKALLRDYPDIDEIDGVTVDVLVTYNILIHRSSTHYLWCKTPEDWQMGAGQPTRVSTEINFF